MLKTYKRRYVKSYTYHDPETGEEERIDFLVSAELFPLFKSYTGVELGKALNDYRRELAKIMNEDTLKAVANFETSEDKVQVLIDNKEAFEKMYQVSEEANNVDGLDLVESLLIVTRTLALPEDDRAEALGAGLELLPPEVLEDAAFAFEILNLAVSYDNFAKKNSSYQKKN